MSDEKRAFWRAWLPGAVLGWVLGAGTLVATLASLLIEANLLTSDAISNLQQNAVRNIVLIAGAGGFGGLLVGLGQGIYLRPRLQKPLSWSLYSAIGWAVGGILIGVLLVAASGELPGVVYTLLGIFILVVPGGLAGVLQRNLLGIPAWVTASTFSVSIGWVVTGVLVALVPGRLGLLIACLAGGSAAAYLAGDALWRMQLDPPRRKKR